MRLLPAVCVLLIVGCRGDESYDRIIHAYVASSLTDVMEVLADTFQTRTGGQLRIALNVAGSSVLARQIAHGAQADLFVSAHPAWTNYLLDAGLVVRLDTLPIGNHLVMVSADGVSTSRSPGRIAVADPAHVPAGLYAREALTCEGRWDAIQARIVPTLSVRAALAAVSEGAVASAVVYATDALLTPELQVTEVVGSGCQPDVAYTVAILKSGSDDADRFLHFLKDPENRSIWREYGFRIRSDE